MTRALWVGLLTALIGLAGLPRFAAAADPAAAKTYAVIVGVSQYPDAQIKPRKHAEADAQALYDLFTNPEYGGAAAADAYLLLGTADEKRHSQPAIKENILKAVHSVVEKAGKDDLVIFAFIGQGTALGDRTGFLASDATVKERNGRAVGSAELEKEFEKLKSQKVCGFVDVGFNSIKEGNLEPSPVDIIKAFIGSEDKEEHTIPQGRVVFLGSSTVTPAIDLDDHGAFTKVIVDGLKGAADKYGGEADGVVTVDELDEYVEKELPQLTRVHGKTTEEKQLLPYDFAARTNHFALAHNPQLSVKVEERLKKLAGLNLPADLAAEGKRLLSRMPKLESDRDLRKQYQKLADGTLTVDAFQASRKENMSDRKLARADAEEFARKVSKGIAALREEYVKELNRGELVGWAVRGMYKRLDEKMPEAVKTRLEKVKTLDVARQNELLADVREQLGKREDLAENKDVDVALGMMMTNLDPYTTYIDKEQKKKFDIETRAQFTGIGVQIRKSLDKDALLVVTPIKGSPAYKAGVKTGDLITDITTDMDKKGKPMDHPETISTKGMSTEDAVKRILGKRGTKVSIKVDREGSSQPLEFDITRGQVEVETVLGAHRKNDDTWDFYLDPEAKIGYIRLTQFAPNSYRDLKAAVEKLDKTGLKGLVLDLRGNPGGLLTSAVYISDLFIDDGLIVTIRPRVGQEQAYGGEHEGSYLNFPMICLVNGGSASGSEIVAACLQDHGRAKIVGERSYGKGSVQNIKQFGETDAEIKLTTASFWRPNGKNLAKTAVKDYNKLTPEQLEKEDWGVRPDPGFALKLSPKEQADLFEHLRDLEIIPRRDGPAKEPKPEFKDKQLESGLDYLRGQIKTAQHVPEKKKAG